MSAHRPAASEKSLFLEARVFVFPLLALELFSQFSKIEERQNQSNFW